MSHISVRDANDSDMAAVRRIYAHYVSHGLSTFEEAPPSLDELLSRRQLIIDAGLPYLVAAVDGQIAGFAYASRYRYRSAYRFTIEDTVYVADDWRQMVAVIGDSANAGSIALHKRLGFERIGTLKSVGFKLGRWVDTVLMQRALGRSEGF